MHADMNRIEITMKHTHHYCLKKCQNCYNINTKQSSYWLKKREEQISIEVRTVKHHIKTDKKIKNKKNKKNISRYTFLINK